MSWAASTRPRHCIYCGAPLARKRRNARYCDGTCRAEAAHVRAGRREAPPKAQLGVASASRRPSRDGKGARIYVTPAEACEWEAGILAGSLRDKLDGAAERLRGPSR